MAVIAPSEGGRWLRAVLYVVTIGTGIWSVAWPSQNLVGYGSGALASAFGVTLAISGACCLYGTLRGTWIGEHVGLPFTTLAMAGYAILLCWTISDSLGRGTAAGLAIMATMLLADRWRGVRIVARLSREDAARDPRNP